uniref:Uncharacterized protein n=1 Tax=Oryza meridionalis TaxID=40149 RepID=A0A0E0ET56_9ORYZ
MRDADRLPPPNAHSAAPTRSPLPPALPSLPAPPRSGNCRRPLPFAAANPGRGVQSTTPYAPSAAISERV